MEPVQKSGVQQASSLEGTVLVYARAALFLSYCTPGARQSLLAPDLAALLNDLGWLQWGAAEEAQEAPGVWGGQSCSTGHSGRLTGGSLQGHVQPLPPHRHQGPH